MCQEFLIRQREVCADTCRLKNRAGMDSVFYYPDIHSQLLSGTRIIALKIHDLFALKYKVLPHFNNYNELQ